MIRLCRCVFCPAPLLFGGNKVRFSRDVYSHENWSFPLSTNGSGNQNSLKLSISQWKHWSNVQRVTVRPNGRGWSLWQPFSCAGVSNDKVVLDTYCCETKLLRFCSDQFEVNGDYDKQWRPRGNTAQTTFHRGLHCILGQVRSPEKEMKYFYEIPQYIKRAVLT